MMTGRSGRVSFARKSLQLAGEALLQGGESIERDPRQWTFLHRS